MALDIEILNTASTADVAQVAQAGEHIEPWANALLGMGTVMTALILIWVVTAIVGSYFVKAKAAPGKPKAAAPAPAAPAAAPAAAANDIPLAAIIAAAVHMAGGPVRNVTVNAPGMESPVWVGQGRSAIFASHAAKSPNSVRPLGGVK